MALAALEDVAALDPEAFKTHRHGAGRKAIALDDGILKQLRTLITANNGMMGTKHFGSTSAEAEAYNGQRETAAKKAGREVPPPLTKVGNAERLARKDASRFTPYVQRIADEMDPPKAASLRVRNEGTEDKPACRWAFVIVNTRERKAKETPAATTA